MKKIDPKILGILSAMTIEGNVAKLNSGQLDRSMYTSVNKVLDAMGGKWNRKYMGHLFDQDPTEKLESVLLTGEVVCARVFCYVPTTQPMCCRVADLAELKPGELVLEPEAGQAAIADEAARRVGQENVHCIELLQANAAVLIGKGYAVQAGDFLQVEPRPVYHKVVMNPPFERQQDVDHVRHAFKFLRPGGRLVAIMSAGITFRTNKKSTQFREMVEEFGFYEENPGGSFKASGTMVNTITVVMDKPGSDLDQEKTLTLAKIPETEPGLEPALANGQQNLFPWYERKVA